MLRTGQLTRQRAQLAARQAQGGQVGDSIVTAEASRTAHNRATLIDHRPMPYYGAVNASVNTDQAAPVVQAQGIRTPPGSMCVYACIMDGGQPKCPTTAQTGSFSAQGPSCVEGKATWFHTRVALRLLCL